MYYYNTIMHYSNTYYNPEVLIIVAKFDLMKTKISDTKNRDM